MSQEEKQTPPEAAAKASLGQKFARMATWKKLLVVSAGVLVLAGCIFQVLAWMNPPPDFGPSGGGTGGSGGTGLGSSFVESSGGGSTGSTVKTGDQAWSEGLFKLGFSFFAGFAIGSFVRGFLKLFLFFAGAALLLMFALDYFDVASIKWKRIDGWFDTAKDKILGETNSFREFISTRLPSGGMAGLGLFTGFKKG